MNAIGLESITQSSDATINFWCDECEWMFFKFVSWDDVPSTALCPQCGTECESYTPKEAR
jgi:hypothetical protein